MIVIASEQRELEPSLHEMGGSAEELRSNAVMLLVHRLDRWCVYFVAVEFDSGVYWTLPAWLYLLCGLRSFAE